MASIDDLITGVTDGSRPVVTTLTAQKELGAASLSVDSLEGWEETTAVHFAIYRLDSTGKKITGSQSDWKGVISGGSTISSLQLRAGDDDVYEIGCIVECMPTAAWADDLAAGLLVSHNPDGTLKSSIVTAAKIADSAVTTAKLAAAAVTAPKIGFGGDGVGIWWEEIARATLVAPGETIALDNIPARKFLKFMWFIVPSGGTINPAIQFNSDNGNNYSSRLSGNGSADSATSDNTKNYLDIAGPRNSVHFGEWFMSNFQTSPKISYSIAMTAGSTNTGSSAPDRREQVQKWADVTQQTSRIDVFDDGGTGVFGTGSVFIVLGHD